MRLSSINTTNRNIACPIRLPAATEARRLLIATIGVAHWPVQTPRPQNRSCPVVPSAFTMMCFRATSMGSSVSILSILEPHRWCVAHSMSYDHPMTRGCRSEQDARPAGHRPGPGMAWPLLTSNSRQSTCFQGDIPGGSRMRHFHSLPVLQ